MHAERSFGAASVITGTARHNVPNGGAARWPGSDARYTASAAPGRAGPGYRGGAHLRVFPADGVDDLRPGPLQRLGDQPGAEPTGCAEPLSLQLIEPGHELALRRAIVGGRAVMAVAVAGQQPEVVTEQMTARSSASTARATASPRPACLQAIHSAGPARRRTERHNRAEARWTVRSRLSPQPGRPSAAGDGPLAVAEPADHPADTGCLWIGDRRSDHRHHKSPGSVRSISATRSSRLKPRSPPQAGEHERRLPMALGGA
jgi:hypothetical protein